MKIKLTGLGIAVIGLIITLYPLGVSAYGAVPPKAVEVLTSYNFNTDVKFSNPQSISNPKPAPSSLPYIAPSVSPTPSMIIPLRTAPIQLDMGPYGPGSLMALLSQVTSIFNVSNDTKNNSDICRDVGSKSGTWHSGNIPNITSNLNQDDTLNNSSFQSSYESYDLLGQPDSTGMTATWPDSGQGKVVTVHNNSTYTTWMKDSGEYVQPSHFLGHFGGNFPAGTSGINCVQTVNMSENSRSSIVTWGGTADKVWRVTYNIFASYVKPNTADRPTRGGNATYEDVPCNYISSGNSNSSLDPSGYCTFSYDVYGGAVTVHDITPTFYNDGRKPNYFWYHPGYVSVSLENNANVTPVRSDPQ